jgi:transposase
MRGDIRLNDKEQRRLLILNKVNQGELTAAKAGELLGRSVRQVRRLLSRYRKRGAAAVIHGNRGRHPAHVIRSRIRNRIIQLAKTTYKGFNQQHFTEMLAEQESIQASRSSVRRILQSAGIVSPRRRRSAKHRLRRERYAQEGMLVQIDGSPHHWLGPDHRKLTLLTAIDDATGKLLNMVFRDQEDAQGYMLLLRGVVEQFGCPIAVYRDRHGIFQRFPNRPSIQQQLDPTPQMTQLGRTLRELGIQSIPAYSPQAKGRVERGFATLQDRLVNELRLVGATTVAEANQYLLQFLPRYNRRFAVQPAVPKPAYQPVPHHSNLDAVFCFKYSRSVGADNVVRLGPHRLQILPDHHRISYAKARVEVHERMDGSVAVYYRDRCLAAQAAPAEAPVLRVRHTPLLSQPASEVTPIPSPPKTAFQKVAGALRQKHKPAATHPWKRKTRLWLGKREMTE